MNLKHLIFIVLILFLLSQVSASENVSYFNNTTEITFEGVDFVIPQGFGQAKANENYDDLGSEGKTCFYVNEAQGEIIITVISDWMGMSLDELYQNGASKVNINGHEGWHYVKDNLTYFGYLSDEKAIIVGVVNETRLHEVIV